MGETYIRTAELDADSFASWAGSAAITFLRSVIHYRLTSRFFIVSRRRKRPA